MTRWPSRRDGRPTPRLGHSEWYVERFRRMAAEGDDLAGEARLVDAMLPPWARVLDAGCGTGRVGGCRCTSAATRSSGSTRIRC